MTSAPRTIHIIGDVHGHAAQLRDMLRELGYTRPDPDGDPDLWEPPDGCELVFVGDLVDRGPENLGCLRIALRMIRAGRARMVLGNHDSRLIEQLRGQLGLGEPPGLSLGRRMTWVELLGLTDGEKREMLSALEEVPLFLSLDGGRLVVVHARWEKRFSKLKDQELLRACAFGRTDWDAPGSRRKEPRPCELTAEPYLELSPYDSLPERALWTLGYTDQALVVWGHQVVRHGAVARIGRTVNVESGCFLGHRLSAYIYPQGRVVQVPGGQPWRARIEPYLPALDTVYPRSLELVEQLLREEGLKTREDYFAWIELVLEATGAPPLTEELEATHRKIFDRVVERWK